MLDDSEPADMYYNKQGKPIDMGTWTILQWMADYRTVAIESVGSITVSTVWLGTGSQFAPLGLPLIFETMMFRPDGGLAMGGYQERYATEKEALAGHALALTAAKNTCPYCMRIMAEHIDGVDCPGEMAKGDTA